MPVELLGMAGQAALGMGVSAIQNEQQRKQQGRLQNLSIQGSKELMDYQMAQQLKMWKDTNYAAQVDELEKAGLNPALLYGKGGGGGSTVGSPSASVGTANAQPNFIMGMQMAKQLAETKLIEAQTRNVETNTVKTAGVDTREAEGRIELLTANVSNVNAQKELAVVEAELVEIRREVASLSKQDAIATVKYEMKAAYEKFNMMERNNWIDEKTKHDKVKIVGAELVQIGLENALLRAQRINTNADTALKGEQIEVAKAMAKKIYNDVVISWEQLSREDRRLGLQQIMAYDNWDGIDDVQSFIESVIGFGIMKQVFGGGGKPPEIGGFHKR